MTLVKWHDSKVCLEVEEYLDFYTLLVYLKEDYLENPEEYLFNKNMIQTSVEIDFKIYQTKWWSNKN